VIERLSKEQRGRSVDVNAVRVLAEEGNRVFRFVADYAPGVSEEEFESFVDSAEAWILAEVSLGGEAESDAEPALEDEEAELDIDTDSVDAGDAGDAEDDWQ
jgi:hypothetical protein